MRVDKKLEDIFNQVHTELNMLAQKCMLFCRVCLEFTDSNSAESKDPFKEGVLDMTQTVSNCEASYNFVQINDKFYTEIIT